MPLCLVQNNKRKLLVLLPISKSQTLSYFKHLIIGIAIIVHRN